MKLNLHPLGLRFSALLAATLVLTSGLAPSAPSPTHDAVQSTPGPVGVLYADKQNVPVYIPAPSGVRNRAPLRADAIQIIVNYNPASCGSNVVAWPNNARDAFEYGVSIWRWVLNGTRPIVVDACWRTDLAANILGNAGPSLSYKDFSGAPQADTWYPVPLANQFANSDLNGNAVEIQARFNANQTWYMGLDGNVPLNQYDLVTVVIHEMGHGLGFVGSMTWDDGNAANGTECNNTAGVGCWGTAPSIYDRFTQNVTGTLISLGNNTPALGGALIGDTLAFNGPNANAANGGTPPRLHGTNPWVAGTTYIHLREATYPVGSLDALMTPALSAQEAIHHPGAIALGMLQDMGWRMPNLAITYVDASNTTGIEDGTFSNPFNTVVEGVGAVDNRGIVVIQAGNYPGAVTALRPMNLQAVGGTVVIGAP